jgi:hypothetical protein
MPGKAYGEVEVVEVLLMVLVAVPITTQTTPQSMGGAKLTMSRTS